MVFSILKKLYSHQHYLIPEHFISTKEILYPLAVTPHINLYPVLCSYTLFVWICLFWTLYIKISYNVCPFASGFFHLAYCFQCPSMLWHISVYHFVLLLNFYMLILYSVTLLDLLINFNRSLIESLFLKFILIIDDIILCWLY